MLEFTIQQQHDIVQVASTAIWLPVQFQDRHHIHKVLRGVLKLSQKLRMKFSVPKCEKFT